MKKLDSAMKDPDWRLHIGAIETLRALISHGSYNILCRIVDNDIPLLIQDVFRDPVKSGIPQFLSIVVNAEVNADDSGVLVAGVELLKSLQIGTSD